MRALATLAVATTLAGLTGPGPFGLTPVPTAAGLPRPYFTLALAPGQSAQDTVVVSNPGGTAERLDVGTAQAVTAQNSGSAFGQFSRQCAGAGCWVTGLPPVVTVGPGAGLPLRFTVTVPAGTRPGQYLAGIAAEPAARPAAVRVGRAGRSSARAVIIDQVIVGVAVTVGRLARLHTALVISPVTAGSVGPMPRLYVPVHNSGQTFARATGTVACRAGQGPRRRYRVIMETVLPGQGAVLPVNAPRLSGATAACTVRLHTGPGRTATWSGEVRLTAPANPVTVHTGDGVYSALPQDPVPWWAVALLVLGGLILAALIAVIVRRRPRTPGSPSRAE